MFFFPFSRENNVWKQFSQPKLSWKPNERQTFAVLVGIASSRRRHSPINSRTRLSLHGGLIINEKPRLLLHAAGEDRGKLGRRRWTRRSSNSRSSSRSRGLASRNPRIRFQFLESRPKQIRKQWELVLLPIRPTIIFVDFFSKQTNIFFLILIIIN